MFGDMVDTPVTCVVPGARSPHPPSSLPDSFDSFGQSSCAGHCRWTDPLKAVRRDNWDRFTAVIERGLFSLHRLCDWITGTSPVMTRGGFRGRLHHTRHCRPPEHPRTCSGDQERSGNPVAQPPPKGQFHANSKAQSTWPTLISGTVKARTMCKLCLRTAISDACGQKTFAENSTMAGTICSQ